MDELLRQLEREYSIDPSPVLKQRIDVLRHRLGLIDIEAILEAVSEVTEEMGSEELASRFSIGEDELFYRIAEFGYALAVNGNLIRDGRGEFLPGKSEQSEEVPSNYALTDRGGDVYSQEAVIPMEYVYGRVVNRINLSKAVLELIGREEGLGEYAFSSPSGDTTVYHRMGRCPNCQHSIDYYSENYGDVIECENCEVDIEVVDDISGTIHEEEAEICDECEGELDEDSICQDCNPDCPECGAGTHQGVCLYHGPVE